MPERPRPPLSLNARRLKAHLDALEQLVRRVARREWLAEIDRVVMALAPAAPPFDHGTLHWALRERLRLYHAHCPAHEWGERGGHACRLPHRHPGPDHQCACGYHWPVVRRR
jgi:tRNA G37 N-methylase Trm5